jgi:transposase
VEAVSLDSTSVKVSPGRDGRAEKNGPQAIGKSRGGWTTTLHPVAADARSAVGFSLSAGQAGDAPEGRKLLTGLSLSAEYVIMDKACEGDETRQTVCDLGLTPVVPPKSNRVDPWEYDRERYKQRNEVERLFRRLKGFRRIFTRFDKLDVVYTFFVYFALIVDALNSVNTP